MKKIVETIKNTICNVIKNTLHNAHKGFTLIELMVVILIIGILAAIALPQYEKSVERSRVAEPQTILKAMSTAQQECILRTGNYENCASDRFWGNTSFEPPTELIDDWDVCLDTSPCFKTQYWEYWSDDYLYAGRVKNNKLVAYLGSSYMGVPEVLDIYCKNISDEDYCKKIGMDER